MRIKSVHFEAFKSLYDLTASFEDLTVVTGANGSGKTNLVDGLVFISNTYLHGLEFAVSHGGGYENIAHRRTRRARKPIEVGIEVALTSAEVREYGRRFGREDGGARRKRAKPKALTVRHVFAFRAVSSKLTADFRVLKEELTISDFSGRELARVVRVGDSIRVLRADDALDSKELLDGLLYFYEFDEGLSAMSLSPSELFLVRRYLPDVFWFVSRYLSSIRVFQLSPHTSRLSGVASPGAQLEQHGENLPGAADYLRRNHPDAWDSIESSMRSIIPTLEEVGIAYTEDRRLAVQFREKGVGRPWNASEVSDGTLQTLALLVAIHDPRSSILVIEELENALHPWILRQLISICSESPRQILLTTHSPVLLNYVSPESVQLMWMSEGRSHMAPLALLDPDVSKQVLDGSISIFDLYDSGLIEQGIPRGMIGTLQ